MHYRADLVGLAAAVRHPCQVWIVPALAKGPTGKILKRSISVPPPEAG